MTPDDLRLRVEAHYKSTEEPLLLSAFGKDLRRAGVWPPAGEVRPLAEFIEACVPGLSLVRDPEASAFVIVVPTEKESIARLAIARRHNSHLLRNLSRPALLAFCVNTPPGVDVYLRALPPHRYLVGQTPGDDAFVLVEAEFRSPGLYVDDSRQIAPEAADRLADGVRRWAQKHNVALDNLIRNQSEENRSAASAAVPSRGANALERLYAAQPAELVDRLVVPLDLALTLSRLP